MNEFFESSGRHNAIFIVNLENRNVNKLAFSVSIIGGGGYELRILTDMQGCGKYELENRGGRFKEGVKGEILWPIRQHQKALVNRATPDLIPGFLHNKKSTKQEFFV